MIKKLILNSLLGTFILGANTIANEGPSIDDTIAFINKTLNDSSKCSKEDSYPLSKNKYTFAQNQNLEINFKNNCHLKVSYDFDAEYQAKYGTYFIINYQKGKASINADISKSLLSYNAKDKRIHIEDRAGLNNIESYYFREKSYQNAFGYHKEGDYESNEPVSFKGIQVQSHGVYQEKMNKALKHLSDKCFEKYGEKDTDLF